MKLALEAYIVAKQLPATERFELSAQIRRAAVSVPSNVAEGQASGPGRRYLYHVRIALGSWGELVTHLELVAPASLSEFEAQLDRTGQLLHGLHRSLKRRAVGKAIGVLMFAGWILSSVVS